MVNFNQSGQRVETQINNVGDIHFGTVQTEEDFKNKLEQLIAGIINERNQHNLDEKVSESAENHLKEAVQQANQPTPNSSSILKHLAAAKTIIEGTTAASGLVTSLVGAIEAAAKIYHW